MIENVLDASAVLAVLQNEPSRERVEVLLDQAAVGRINVTEILTTLINKGVLLADAIAAFDSLELRVIEFDKIQSERVSSLRTPTKHLGLSLGDRACLALAILENATAVTAVTAADRSWSELDVCPVEVIR